MLTALGNFGSSISSYNGALVLLYFDIGSSNYDNLYKVIILKSITRLLPLILIPYLVPNGGPLTPVEEDVSENGIAMSGLRKNGYSGVVDVSSHPHSSLLRTGSSNNSTHDNENANSSIKMTKSPFRSADECDIATI